MKLVVYVAVVALFINVSAKSTEGDDTVTKTKGQPTDNDDTTLETSSHPGTKNGGETASKTKGQPTDNAGNNSINDDGKEDGAEKVKDTHMLSSVLEKLQSMEMKLLREETVLQQAINRVVQKIKEEGDHAVLIDLPAAVNNGEKGKTVEKAKTADPFKSRYIFQEPEEKDPWKAVLGKLNGGMGDDFDDDRYGDNDDDNDGRSHQDENEDNDETDDGKDGGSDAKHSNVGDKERDTDVNGEVRVRADETKGSYGETNEDDSNVNDDEREDNEDVRQSNEDNAKDRVSAGETDGGDNSDEWGYVSDVNDDVRQENDAENNVKDGISDADGAEINDDHETNDGEDDIDDDDNDTKDAENDLKNAKDDNTDNNDAASDTSGGDHESTNNDIIAMNGDSDDSEDYQGGNKDNKVEEIAAKYGKTYSRHYKTKKYHGH